MEKHTYEIEYNHSTNMYEILTTATGRFITHFYKWMEADSYIIKELGGY